VQILVTFYVYVAAKRLMRAVCVAAAARRVVAATALPTVAIATMRVASARYPTPRSPASRAAIRVRLPSTKSLIAAVCAAATMRASIVSACRMATRATCAIVVCRRRHCSTVLHQPQVLLSALIRLSSQQRIR
jgi:hypothetical protein